MLSKPLAALLLVVALACAGLAGGFIATRTFNTPASSDDNSDDMVPVPETPDQAVAPTTGRPGSGGPGHSARASNRPAGGGSGRPTPSSIQPKNTAPAAAATEEAPEFEDLEIPAGELIDIQLQSPLSSETAKVEDRVEARLLKDIKVGQKVAVAAGAKVIGSVTLADKGGHLNEPARLEVQFHTLQVRGQPDLPLVIDKIMQHGPSPSGDSKKKIAGGAAAGAALGWLKGGVAGAVVGGAAGGGAGTATKMMETRKSADLPAGAQARLELRAPVFVTVKNERQAPR